MTETSDRPTGLARIVFGWITGLLARGPGAPPLAPPRPLPAVLTAENSGDTPTSIRDPWPFCRVLEPLDPWLDGSSTPELEKSFRGTHASTSVFSLESCPPQLVMAGFYGPRSGQIRLKPHYLGFTAEEVNLAGGTLTQTPSDPPWPPEYSSAHHDLTGDQVAVARAMVERYSADHSRAVSMERSEVFDEICDLLRQTHAHERFIKNGWKHIRRLLVLEEERETLWATLTLKYPHLLEDRLSQEKLRQLYSTDRGAWDRLAGMVPSLKDDPALGSGSRK